MEKRRIMTLLAMLFLLVGGALAQTKVNGTVLSQDDGQPVIGATVQVVGTTVGTVTNSNGQFSLTCPAGKNVLRITYVGMEPIEVSARPNMRIMLTSDQTALDEVIVVAYGTAKKQSITGSVASIDSKEIEQRIGTSVTGALEGAAPGVQVNNTYGEPGAEPNIRIRGIGSLNGSNSPLYVVDGIIYSGNIADLNPDDIQSISVLKDAASAALYGNRASAGVIIITTKNGRSNNTSQINLKINHGFYNRGIKEYDRLGVKDFMESSWAALKNYGIWNDGLSEADAADYASKNLALSVLHNNIFDKANDALFDANGKLVANVLPGYTDLDWEDNIERTGDRQEYNLNGNYTTDKVNIYSSIGYLKEKGYVVGSDYERFTARLNSQFTPNKWITTGVNLQGTVSTRHFNNNASANAYANPFYVARYMAPVYPVYLHNEDGSIVMGVDGPEFDTTSDYLDNRNIAYELRADQDESRRNVIDGTAFVNLNLPYDFVVSVKGNMAHRTNNRTRYNNPNIGDGATNNGRLSSYAYEYNTYTMQELLNWSHEYGVHHIDAMAGHENYKYSSKSFYGMNTTMAVPDIFVQNNFLNNSYMYGSDDEYTTESYLARVRYNYDQKYFFDASWRRDGSSRFHKDNRWGNFFSVGASWNIKKEAFMEKVDWVDQLRLRASYGETGNDAGVSYYAYKALYYVDKNAGSSALMKQQLAAPDIKWETAQTIDVALEGRLFDRLNFSIGYFDKRNKDLLFDVRLPLSAGSFAYNEDYYNMTVAKNIGTISNYGWEISLDGDIIKNKDWRWTAGIDATFLHNKIRKLPNGDNILSGLHNYTEGRSLYDFYTYHFEGVDQKTGQSLYTIDPEKIDNAVKAGELVNIGGTPIYQTDEKTGEFVLDEDGNKIATGYYEGGTNYTMDTAHGLRDFHKSALPTVYGSFTTGLTYQNLTLNMLMTYSLGGYTFDGVYQSLMSTNSATSGSAIHKDALKAWQTEPANITDANRIDADGTPQMNYNRSSKNNATSDRWLTSANYLVMKNISLSYNLPKSWLNSLGGVVSGVTLTAGVENLFTLTARQGLNPQYNFTGGYDETYVTARVYNFGLSVNF